MILKRSGAVMAVQAAGGYPGELVFLVDLHGREVLLFEPSRAKEVLRTRHVSYVKIERSGVFTYGLALDNVEAPIDLFPVRVTVEGGRLAIRCPEPKRYFALPDGFPTTEPPTCWEHMEG